MKKYLLLLLLFTLLSRFIIVGWGLPYKENEAHEHSLFYDSHSVVYDQYRALLSLYKFPRGFFQEVNISRMPLLQRYLASVPLAIWFVLSDSYTVEKVKEIASAERAYRFLLINRLISILASLGLVILFILLLRKFQLPDFLVFLSSIIFVLNPVEIGLSIHGKSVTLMFMLLAWIYYLLCSWIVDKKHSFNYILIVAFFIGLACTAKEQGLFWGYSLLVFSLIWILRTEVFKYFGIKRLVVFIAFFSMGILLGDAHLLFDWNYWWGKFLHPGRPWDFHVLLQTMPDLWYCLEIVFSGWPGVLLFSFSVAWLFFRFKNIDKRIQVLLLWVVFFLIIFFIYPLKAPRFAQPLVFFGLIIITIGMFDFYSALVTRVVRHKCFKIFYVLVISIWFIYSVIWGCSALAFFSGEDNRLLVAKTFHSSVPRGSSVATFFRASHSRKVPIDPYRYTLYSYCNKYSTDSNFSLIPYDENCEVDSEGKLIGYNDIWPDYLILQYEKGAALDAPEQNAKLKFRSAVIKSGQYDLVKVFEKRSWRFKYPGVFATRSRWAYLNPVVEVYKRIPDYAGK